MWRPKWRMSCSLAKIKIFPIDKPQKYHYTGRNDHTPITVNRKSSGQSGLQRVSRWCEGHSSAEREWAGELGAEPHSRRPRKRHRYQGAENRKSGISCSRRERLTLAPALHRRCFLFPAQSKRGGTTGNRTTDPRPHVQRRLCMGTRIFCVLAWGSK